MKTKLINIIKSYAESNDFNDFNLLLTINNYLSLDETTIVKVDCIDDYIRVSLINGYDKLSIIFYDNGDLGLTLPLSGLFIIKGDDSNMSYCEIKSLLMQFKII